MSIWPGRVSREYGTSTGKAYSEGIARAIARLPTDPFYVANVTLENVVPGSSYIVLDGADEQTVLSAAAVAANATQADPVVVSSVPAYASPQLLLIVVRKSSASPKMKRVRVFGFHNSLGSSHYVSQVADNVAS